MNINRWRWTFWLFAGVTLVGLAGWQIAQITVGQYGLLNPPKPKLPPTKVRSDGRVALASEIVSSDPVGTYIDRSKRGMNDREIGWMIEDFQALELDNPPLVASKERHRFYRAKQQAWYAAALKEGLSLTAEQRSDLKATLADRLAKEFDLLIIPSYFSTAEGNWENLLEDGPDNEFDPLEWSQQFASAEDWIGRTENAPWNLCKLSAEQEKLTLKGWAADKEDSHPEDPNGNPDPFAPDAPAPRWMQGDRRTPVIHDPLTGNQVEVPLVGGTGFHFLPGTSIFPLTLDQQPLTKFRGNPLAQARLCQPAQLRVALLLQPSLIADLNQQLDSPAAPQPPVTPEPAPTSE